MAMTDRFPQTLAPQDDEADALDYLLALIAGLQLEVERRKHESRVLDQLAEDIADFAHSCQAKQQALTFAQWQALWRSYQRLVHRKASALNELATVAQAYPNMDAFWTDAEAQEQARSHHTYWDSYEHGRRRQLEHLLARTYGVESALLVNSGMSAIAVAVGLCKLRSGDAIVTGERCFFEISDYLERFVRASGIDIVRAPMEHPDKVAETLRRVRPALMLVETVTNAPSAQVCCGFNDWWAASPNTFFVIDNSVQSHLTRWFDLISGDPSRLLVAESAVKYLSQNCMAGVLYGTDETLQKARDFARTTGHQLQEKSFNYLCEAEIELVSRKLARQARNVAAFREELSAFASVFHFVHTLDAGSHGDPDAAKLFKNGAGALLFIALPSPPPQAPLSLVQMHRRLLYRWRELAEQQGMEISLRAGFGWNETLARVYESGRLNQPDAPLYLRVSIGIEPLEVIRSLAQSLGNAACEIMRDIDFESSVTPV